MRILDPADFLGLVSGATPLKSEHWLIDTLSKEYGFTSGIINFILDYTLTHCDNKLPEKFVLKVAITLKRSNIKTAYDAMATLYRNDKNAKKYINKDAQVTHRQSATNSDLEETSEKENVDVSNLDVLIRRWWTMNKLNIPKMNNLYKLRHDKVCRRCFIWFLQG